MCSEWTEQQRQFKLQREQFARTQRRPRGGVINYPDDLARPFPKFSPWLNAHVRMLKEEGFPVSRQLESLHCLPSQHAHSFYAMWAFGCHYSCSNETTHASVAFDCGIAAIPPSPTCTQIDVGILRNIIHVTYHGLSCVVMEASWVKAIDQGRRVVKKDPLGF